MTVKGGKTAGDADFNSARNVAFKRTRALVISLHIRAGAQNPPTGALKPLTRPGLNARSVEDRAAEALGLARALNLEIAAPVTVQLSSVRPATLLGSGKVQELEAVISEKEATLAIIDHPVTPVQQRNLERAWNVKVLDRTGLILEIFGARAATREGRLQVELAHLSYQKSRLVRSWTQLDRQRGGFGFLGGPGETQIEADRRLIDERIAAIRAELETVTRTRTLHRDSRRRIPYPAVAIVGYTNAGKSTLFNRLTGATVAAKDMLFATLDPTMREVKLPGGERAIFSDTVGFISDLPTALIAAFRATLEEVIEADIILHVRDIAARHSGAERDDVYAVLKELGAGPDGDGKPVIEVWNKIDRLSGEDKSGAEKLAAFAPHSPVLCSAATGEGLDKLLAAISLRLQAAYVTRHVAIDENDGALLHWIHENASVLERRDDGKGRISFDLRLDKAKAARLDARLPAAEQD